MSPRRTRYRQVAELHVRCLDRSFLATLGVGFLTLMYQAIDESDSSTLLVHEEADTIVGFVTGGIGMGSIYRRMLRNPLRLGLGLAPVLVRPAKLRRVFEILRYSGDGGLAADLPDAELLSIAVAPEWRGRAIADALYRRLQEDFRRRGIDAFRIVVGSALAPAHRFYVRMGAQRVADIEVHAGETSTVYVQRV